jgi:zinc transporter
VEPHGWLWLHFNLADARACHFLRLSSYFPAAARELLVAADDHQQLNASEACLFGVFPDLVFGLDGATDEIGFLHFAMVENLLVTGRHCPLSSIAATRKALRSGRKVPSVAALMDTILEFVIDGIDRYSDDVAGKLDHIEERILADDVSEGRNMLGRITRTTVRLHRQLVILRSLIQRFELDLSEMFALKLTTSKLRQRLDWLDIEVVSLRDRAQLFPEQENIGASEKTRMVDPIVLFLQHTHLILESIPRKSTCVRISSVGYRSRGDESCSDSKVAKAPTTSRARRAT